MTIARPGDDLYGRYCYGPEQTRLIATAATEAMASHDKTALLIGGPRHGETLRFNGHQVSSIRLPKLPSATMFVTPELLFTQRPPTPDYDEYIVTGAVTSHGGKACQILEHTDLPKQNVSAQTEKLEDDLRRAERICNERRETAAAVADRSKEAKERYEDAYADLIRADQARAKHRSEYGV